MPIFRGDLELLRRFRSGDQGALETVYRAYVDRVASIARYGFQLPQGGARVAGVAGSASDVMDIVQEVFVKAFSPVALRSFDGLRDYGPYLFAIARNVTADWARRRGRELPTPWVDLARQLDDQLVPNEDGPPWADAATLAAVARYIESLDGDARRVHHARYVDGLSQRDAAERLGIGRQTLRTLEARLRTGLQRELARLERSRGPKS